MLDFFVQNAANFVLGTAIALAVFLAIRTIVKKRKSGGCVGCSGCDAPCKDNQGCDSEKRPF